MIILFLILVLLASIILGFIILVQNPKGGGLAGNVGGLSNQFMGVKQTTDVLEKGTWIFATVVALLCIFSAFFHPERHLERRSSSPVPRHTSPARSSGEHGFPPVANHTTRLQSRDRRSCRPLQQALHNRQKVPGKARWPITVQ